MTLSELIAIYKNRFINRDDIWFKQYVSSCDGRARYAEQAPDMDTKGGWLLYEPVTPGLVLRHLKGWVTCAWPAIDSNHCSRWICFDSDTEDGDLDKLERTLRSWGIHVIREGGRPGRAGHLWVLFDRPVPATLLIILGDAAIKFAGVRPATTDYPYGIERFPKFAAGLSQVRGPLGINLKPEAKGACGWFDGVEHNVRAQLEWLAVQPLNQAQDAIREAEKHAPKTKLVIAKPRYRKNRRGVNGFAPFNILDYVNYRRAGNSLITQCPVCAGEGHDKHKDNLHITLDGSKFCCWFGGQPGKTHTRQDIVNALLQEAKNCQFACKCSRAEYEF